MTFIAGAHPYATARIRERYWDPFSSNLGHLHKQNTCYYEKRAGRRNADINVVQCDINVTFPSGKKLGTGRAEELLGCGEDPVGCLVCLGRRWTQVDFYPFKPLFYVARERAYSGKFELTSECGLNKYHALKFY